MLGFQIFPQLEGLTQGLWLDSFEPQLICKMGIIQPLLMVGEAMKGGNTAFLQHDTCTLSTHRYNSIIVSAAANSVSLLPRNRQSSMGTRGPKREQTDR